MRRSREGGHWWYPGEVLSGRGLTAPSGEERVDFLKKNIDVFAWDACDTPGIDPAFICHRLNVNPSITPKKQPL